MPPSIALDSAQGVGHSESGTEFDSLVESFKEISLEAIIIDIDDDSKTGPEVMDLVVKRFPLMFDFSQEISFYKFITFLASGRQHMIIFEVSEDDMLSDNENYWHSTVMNRIRDNVDGVRGLDAGKLDNPSSREIKLKGYSESMDLGFSDESKEVRRNVAEKLGIGWK